MPDQHQFHMREEPAEATGRGDDPQASVRAPQPTSDRPRREEGDGNDGRDLAAHEPPLAAQRAPGATASDDGR